MLKLRALSLAFLGLLLATVASAEKIDPRRTVEFLASPELKGRLSGSAGAERAAAYIAEQLRGLGALPLPGHDALLHPFEFTAGTNDAGSRLQWVADGEAVDYNGTDVVQALSFSDNGEVEGSVAFAGYGITVPGGGDFSYDSYAGVDVEGKIALVLRYFPEDSENEQRRTLSRYSGLRYKALRAREMGAIALLVVAGPRSANAGETIPMTFDTALSGSGILAASIDGDLGAKMIAVAGEKTLEQIQADWDNGNPHVAGFDIPGVTVKLQVAVEREKRTANNVVGYFPAAGTTELSWETQQPVVVGAHFDHLGQGGHGNSLAKKDEAGGVHHGADDNASGVAVVLSIAQRLREHPPKRPVIFGLWSGEEIGLLGSTRFVDEEVDVDCVAAYVNFDMVGRVKNNLLVLQAAASSSVWARLIEQSNVMVGFDLRMQDDPYLPTDSTPFYQAGIPALNFFSGSHEDYHRPSDTADRVNYEGLDQVIDLASRLVGKLTKLEQAPDYVKVEPRGDRGGDRDGLRVFTGTIPDYTVEVEGLLLSGVVGGGPAELAGLQGGDVIVEFAGMSITNIYDYTYALDLAKIGKPVKVVFLREGERNEVDVLPTARK